MDPLIAVLRLPRVADAAMRNAILTTIGRGRRPPAGELVGEALVRFERAIQMKAPDGIRPALLFAQRDRILTGLRRFLELRIAGRLFAVRPRDIVAIGGGAKPFDVVVRGKDGKVHAVIFRAIPRDGRKLELFRRVRTAAQRYRAATLESVIVCDLEGGRSRRLGLAGDSDAQGHYRDLRAGGQVQLRQDMRDVVLDRLVAQG